MHPSPAGMDLLTTPPPDVDGATVADALRRHFGLEARLSPLPGERDRNMLVAGPGGAPCVLKLFNVAEPPEARELGRAVLLHLEGARLPFAVPRLLRTRDGATGFAVGGFEAVLTSFVPGEPWDSRAPSATLRGAVGEAGARLGLALAGFDHPAARRSLPWDLMALGRMAPVVAAMADRRRGDWLARFLDRFAAEVRPAALALPSGAVHDDLNGGNVLLRESADAVAGVIDFGDLLHGPRIVDLAVASTYGLDDAADPAEAVADFAEGWMRVFPLAEAEADLLFDLAAARLALRVSIYEWRAGRLGEDRSHVTRHAASAFLMLDRVMALPPGHGRDRVLARHRAAGAGGSAGAAP